MTRLAGRLARVPELFAHELDGTRTPIGKPVSVARYEMRGCTPYRSRSRRRVVS